MRGLEDIRNVSSGLSVSLTDRNGSSRISVSLTDYPDIIMKKFFLFSDIVVNIHIFRLSGYPDRSVRITPYYKKWPTGGWSIFANPILQHKFYTS